ncbi:MAG TPA: hypothetical protein VFC51_05385 [Chloroflexota bacterium]|nr:hypothetical protein [Chloroflexota bacterium]
MSELLNTPISVTCPRCGEKVEATLGDVQGEHRVTCPNGHAIKLKPKNDSLKKVEKALEGLERAVGEGHVHFKVNVTQRERE